MNLTHLKYFRSIAETENISLSAKKLYVAQPALSKSLNALEADIGYKLFDRVGKSLVLNEQGKIFLKYVNKIFDCLDNAQKEIADSISTGQNTICIQINAGAKYFVTLLAEFQRDNPDIRFRIVDNSKENELSADLIVYASDISENTDHSTTLFCESMALAVPSGHPLSSRKDVSANDVQNELLIASTKGTMMRKALIQYCEKHHFSPKLAYEIKNTSLIKAMVSNGLGQAFVPSTTWSDVQDQGLATLIPISDIGFQRYVHIRWNEDHYLTAACRKVIDFLVARHTEQR